MLFVLESTRQEAFERRHHSPRSCRDGVDLVLRGGTKHPSYGVTGLSWCWEMPSLDGDDSNTVPESYGKKKNLAVL